MSALADRLHSLAIHLLRRVRRGDEEVGLSAPRLSALSVIVYRGPISVTELAKAEGVTAPTMTRLVHALVQQGLVDRRAAETDNRVVLLCATPSGRRTLDAARVKRLAALQALLAPLTPEERDVVTQAVDALEPLLGHSHRA
jgi:DNA-binding MarR family transcriptional regulator